MKPNIKVIASYYRSGTLDELRDKGQMSVAEYQRHVEAVKAYEAQSKGEEKHENTDVFSGTSVGSWHC